MSLCFVSFELSALYGLVRPNDGRKLFTSFDRLLFSAPYLSTIFHQKFFPSEPRMFLKNLVLLELGYFGSIHAITALHEIGHYLAMKALFVDVNPSIAVFWNGSGECSWGGPGQLLSTLGQRMTHRQADGLVSLAGPLIHMIGALLSSIGAYQLSESRHLPLTPWLCGFSLRSVFGNLAYAISNADGMPAHDFRKMSDCFGIPRIYLTLASIASAILPTVLCVASLRRRLDSEPPKEWNYL